MEYWILGLCEPFFMLVFRKSTTTEDQKHPQSAGLLYYKRCTCLWKIFRQYIQAKLGK